MTEAVTVTLVPWRGLWADDDPNANFKSDVALYSLIDPLTTLWTLSDCLGIPVGALCWYVLARWASAGSSGLLELGPAMANRLWATCEIAELAGTEAARLDAYRKLHDMLSWLRAPLDGPAGYGALDV